MSGAPTAGRVRQRVLAAAKYGYVSARRAVRSAWGLVLLLVVSVGPKRVECPICGGRFRRFLAHGLERRENARCPRCGSLERQRLLYLYLQRRTGFFRNRVRVLHFAPEPYFLRFGTLPNVELVTADLSYPHVDVNLDITRLPLPDDSFDVVLCSHVLEHVPNDAAAMREIQRVLKPGGWSVLMVPFERSRAETFEDPSVTDPSERERLFGQYDHVRVYGRDYTDRLRRAGLDVLEDELVRELDGRKYGLLDEPVHVGVKPAAAATAEPHEPLDASA